MATTVELEVSDSGFSFTLDDPVRGKLDNVTYTLALGWRDVTDYVYSLSMRRGRNRELDRFDAGQVLVELRNNDRTFDPLNTTSLFYGEILPRRQIRIFTDEIQQYQGFIDSWDFSYNVSGESLASVSASDGFTKLAQAELADQSVSAQSTGDRINAVLSNANVGWPVISRNIDAGSSTLAAGTATGNALQYLQLVETSELGYLFISKSGDVTFKGRNYYGDAVTYITFADDGSGISFTGASVTYGTDMMYNQAIVEYPSGTTTATVQADDASSQDSFGIISHSVETLLGSVTQANDYAEFIVGKYSWPEYRFADVAVSLDGISKTYRADLLLAEIGDLVEIRFTPNGVGSQIVRFAELTKIEHRVGIDRHDMVFGFTSVEFVGFILNDLMFGRLDSGLLAF